MQGWADNSVCIQTWKLSIQVVNEIQKINMPSYTEFPRLNALHVLDASVRFNAGCCERKTF